MAGQRGATPQPTDTEPDMTTRPLISRSLFLHRLPAPGRLLLALAAPLRRRWRAMLDAEHLAGQPRYLLADVGLDAEGIARIRQGRTTGALHRTITVDRTGRPA